MSTAGTDAPTLILGTTPSGDPLLAGLRRLMRLADGAAEPEAVMRALASELFGLLGAAEIHVHHLAPEPGAQGDEPQAAAADPVVVYMFGGDGRLSYEFPAPSGLPASRGSPAPARACW